MYMIDETPLFPNVIVGTFQIRWIVRALISPKLTRQATMGATTAAKAAQLMRRPLLASALEVEVRYLYILFCMSDKS